MTRVSIIAEQLRRPTPGGIGTYVRGLLAGIAEASAASRAGVDVARWTSRLPPQVRTRLWDHGIGAVRGDVVHAPSLATPARAHRLVVTVHDLAWRTVPDAFPPRGASWHERALHTALRRADAFVVPSHAVAAALVDAGADAAVVHTIAEGSDHLPSPAASPLTGDFILSVSTLEPRKNLERLVAAFGKARSSLPSGCRLVVVGPRGWGHSALDEDGVVRLGAVGDAALAGLYDAARAVAYVPLAEGFGLPPVEAMRAGTPVVASSAVPSVGDAALLVDPVDVDAIAAALVSVACDERLREDLIARGRAHAGALTWRATAERHLELWRSLQ